MAQTGLKCENRIIAHVDMDAFFVSVEELLNPAIKGKPIVVGADPSGRGVVCAASYKAREYGIHSAMPIAKAKRLCPAGSIFLRGSPQVYAEYSRKIMDILGKFTPVVQPVSVDEAYLDLTGCLRVHGAQPSSVAVKIHDTIRDETGLSASIGVASNKITAKIAANIAKPNGMLYIHPGREAAFLAPLPIGAMPGVGPSVEAKMRRLGICVVGDLAKFAPEILAGAIGKYGHILSARANGVDPRPVKQTADKAKSISRETTYQSDTNNLETVLSTISYLAEKVARDVRLHRFTFRRITLKLRYSGFETCTRSHTLPIPSDDTKIIYRTSAALLRPLMDKRRKARLVGVGVSYFSEPASQLDMFKTETDTAGMRLNIGTDMVKARYGFESVLIARSLLHSIAKTSH